jgi:hypothetical protein
MGITKELAYLAAILAAAQLEPFLGGPLIDPCAFGV